MWNGGKFEDLRQTIISLFSLCEKRLFSGRLIGLMKIKYGWYQKGLKRELPITGEKPMCLRGINLILSQFINYKHMNLNRWEMIDWKLVNKRVNRLQRRIYKQAKLGKSEKVHYLQKKMIYSFDAKLLSVRKVTVENKGKRTPGIDKNMYKTGKNKYNLAKTLRLNEKANFIVRKWIPKPGKTERRPLGIPTLKDRAKQTLVKLALEPEWEARFKDPNSYGFRPGRCVADAIEATFLSVRISATVKPKFVLEGNLKGCYDNIDHEYLLDKLETFPLVRTQIKAWLKAGIFDAEIMEETDLDENIHKEKGPPQGGILSPLLANIALDGFETYIKNWIANNKSINVRTNDKFSSLGVVRYAEAFIVIYKDEKILSEVWEKLNQWFLKNPGVQLDPVKTKITDLRQGILFLGFKIMNIRRGHKYRTLIIPSRENQKKLLYKVNQICRKYKSISTFDFIQILAPIILGWGHFFCISECTKIFSSLNHKISFLIRKWVFRRCTNTKRTKMKLRYFPEGKTYKFQGNKYQDNWILYGKKTFKEKVREKFLPHLQWIKSKKHVKVKQFYSPFDEHDAYWKRRTMKYSSLSYSQKTLWIAQNSLCLHCGNNIHLNDTVETDHIIPRKYGGPDEYQNLQLLHKHCHVEKTRKDLKVR